MRQQRVWKASWRSWDMPAEIRDAADEAIRSTERVIAKLHLISLGLQQAQRVEAREAHEARIRAEEAVLAKLHLLKQGLIDNPSRK